MSVFDHVYYPFHHDHINTPLITPFELQMVGGGCRMKTGGGVITPLGGLDKSLVPMTFGDLERRDAKEGSRVGRGFCIP